MSSERFRNEGSPDCRQESTCNLYPDREAGPILITPGRQPGARTDAGSIAEYISNQQEHHKKEAFNDEYHRLIIESGITFDESYFP